MEGVKRVSRANWFGGVYIDKRNFFPQFAVDGAAYLELYPEYRVPPEQMKAFLLDRKGCVVGRKLAQTYGWKLGDVVPLRGTIFPGNWEFVVRAIYDGADAEDRRLAVVLPLGLSERDPQAHRPAPRQPGRHLPRRHRRRRRGGADLARTSIACSGTRWPRP